MSPNTRGALFILAGVACFNFNFALVKGLGGALPLFEILGLRGLLVLALFAILGLWTRTLTFRLPAREWRWVLLRAALEISATICFFTALLRMPLADLTAISQALPLAVTLAAVLFLGERVGWHRTGALIAGFLGVLLIVRPGGSGYDPATPFALGSIVLSSARDIVTRRISPDTPSTTVSFFTSVGLAGVAFALWGAGIGPDWVGPNVVQASLLFGSSVFALVAYLCLIAGTRSGDVSFVSAFRFTSLPWALVLGYVFFSEWPDQWSLIGSVIVLASGLYTFARTRNYQASDP